MIFISYSPPNTRRRKEEKKLIAKSLKNEDIYHNRNKPLLIYIDTRP